jgi:hypothetical protein
MRGTECARSLARLETWIMVSSSLPPLPPRVLGFVYRAECGFGAVRMLLKQGYRHVYVSRPFALKHGLIPKTVSDAEWLVTALQRHIDAHFLILLDSLC